APILADLLGAGQVAGDGEGEAALADTDGTRVAADDSRNALVVRTMSKSFSLAGLRIGFAFGHRALIAGLMKVKDSYNVNRLSQAAALAVLNDPDYFRACIACVKATRDRLRAALIALGFSVFPSAANFLLARPPRPLTAKKLYETLRARQILVRWWNDPRVRNHVRISIGTDDETDKLLAAIREILAQNKEGRF
ncbi:MAG: aminotransferase class I/II-fold pyridoxal phosphate-dependent enzyme, partial [Verrucomicrobiae bacterium]|nr:aminotransferase class I/II-fold pyridoxal phosphate-dependent enzyme [Verrucomicrobiae bacterium]